MKQITADELNVLTGFGYKIEDLTKNHGISKAAISYDATTDDFSVSTDKTSKKGRASRIDIELIKFADNQITSFGYYGLIVDKLALEYKDNQYFIEMVTKEPQADELATDEQDAQETDEQTTDEQVTDAQATDE
ncbi:hypothetical protein LU293_04190 [Moraxella nasovis]|uniref:hypothetical protein n=1 Tax=Moraxella nasovis TaxID=2904121 RepID=UPI001F624685|nr:hypothetical protein [Moraxella nasovis]UNU74102.1 hypothetical protein LU293_04190 [Moraxella nasovis]